MDWTHLLAFNAALAAAWLAPGPAMLVALRAALTGGWAEGAATGAGLALVAALWTLAALFGLDALFTLFPWAYGALTTAGALYLLWIAVQTWRHARDPLPDAPASRARAIRTGVLVNLANPKSVLFAGAVLVVIFPPDLAPAARLAIGLNHFLFEVVAYAALSLLIARSGIARPLLAAKAALDRVTAAILGALGLRLLLDRAP